MSNFKKESEIQKLLEEALSNKDLFELIENTNYIEGYKYLNNSSEEKKYYNSFKNTLQSLHSTRIISADENISLDKNESLKPDILLYSAETQGIVVVELKNLSQTTRDLGTEIYAYSGEIRTYFPFISDSEIFYVIVSTEWPTLLKHFIFHEIYWQSKNIICLEPIKINGMIKLKIKNIFDLFDSVTLKTIPKEALSGFQICLYNPNNYQTEEEILNLDKHLNQMHSTLQVISNEGNKQNSHGFAFLWKDSYIGPAPYNITVLNLAPFSSVERFLHTIDNLAELTEMQKRVMIMIQEEEPSGHGNFLTNIHNISIKFLKNFCNPVPEAFSTWPALKGFMLNSKFNLLGFQGWGIFGIEFTDKLIYEYSHGNIQYTNFSPELGLKVIESLIDENYEFYDISGLPLNDNIDEVNDLGIEDEK